MRSRKRRHHNPSHPKNLLKPLKNPPDLKSQNPNLPKNQGNHGLHLLRSLLLRNQSLRNLPPKSLELGDQPQRRKKWRQSRMRWKMFNKRNNNKMKSKWKLKKKRRLKTNRNRRSQSTWRRSRRALRRAEQAEVVAGRRSLSPSRRPRRPQADQREARNRPHLSLHLRRELEHPGRRYSQRHLYRRMKRCRE